MLSDMQWNVQKQIESAANEETKFRLKIYWNQIMMEIHREKKREKKCQSENFYTTSHR